MRMKLGAGLAERNLAPHVFETWAEAQAFSTPTPAREGAGLMLPLNVCVLHRAGCAMFSAP